MFTPTLCGPAYGTIQRKIVVKLRFYNDLLLFEGLFEDPREGFLKPFKRREGDSNPRNAFDVYTLSRRASSATRAPLLGLGNSCWAMRGLYMFAAD